jgi:hypothetical protein
VLRQEGRRDEGRGGPGKLIARALELSWVVDLREEIESDFSVFHQIRDPLGELDGPGFYRYARQLHRYFGAVAHAIAEKRTQQHVDDAPAAQGPTESAPAGGLDPILAAVIPRGARVQYVADPRVAAAQTDEGRRQGFASVSYLA